MVIFNTNYALAEVLIHAPSVVRLSCSIAHDKMSGLAKFDVDRKLWQCLFRPRSSGYHTLNIYTRQGKSTASYEGATECQIFEPLLEKFKQSARVTILCHLPSARYVCLPFDGTLSSKEYSFVNNIFKLEITVPNREIIIYGKFVKSKKNLVAMKDYLNIQ
ncbi:unnamed protein product [Rotaria sp. Silwood2]|nr:unnamed protein product [Rotaria sp. Silwood2]CAF2980350.1 unnamed protein product [Rotaria sp. Silwood2]CAF4274262.1 unnamed protein product [Rotaria sp. Silwood2]CAF4280915.1 unnamed protein product [Rotaria sp. Silwood2]